MSGSEVTVNGLRLVFDLHGAGSETVVLAGPIGAPGAAWVPFQVPALVEAGYRVVTFNPRGVPPSQVPPRPTRWPIWRPMQRGSSRNSPPAPSR